MIGWKSQMASGGGTSCPCRPARSRPTPDPAGRVLRGPPARRRWRSALGLLGVTLLGLASGCGDGGQGQPLGAQPPRSSIHPILPPTSEDDAAASASRPPKATFALTTDGAVLPDPTETQGAFFADVTAAEICDLHYIQGVRQPRFNDKVAAFTAYGISIHDRDLYHVDHLVPISLGGNNDEANLWPQPYDEEGGADQKNLLERQLRGLVCSHKVTLDDARQAITRDWWRAYQTYMDMPIDPGTAGPEPWTRPTQVPGEVVNGGTCESAGAVGYTTTKRIRLTCALTSFGELRWQKRY